MSEALKKYQALLAEIKAEKGYKPNMGAAGKALLVECVLEAQRQYSSKRADKSKPIIGRPKRGPQSKRGQRSTFALLDKKIYKCAGLSVNDCAVAPHCFYQPKADRCVLRSGKDAVGTFNSPKRVAMLEQLIDEDAPLGYYYP